MSAKEEGRARHLLDSDEHKYRYTILIDHVIDTKLW